MDFQNWSNLCQNLSTMKAFIIGLVFINIGFVHAQWNPHFTSGRTTMVHLFEWTWNDVAAECKGFLKENGYGGVQVSPVNENRVFNERGYVRPWFERYQPVSYSLNTTGSGNETEFKAMVKTCNNAGIRIYVDAVINHMCGGGGINGIGTGGSTFDYFHLSYPAVPYTEDEFNGAYNCHTRSGNIENYHDAEQVRNCRLSSPTDQLSDLNHGDPDTEEAIVEFLNRLISFGVAGFRIDAAKHMWPAHLETIVSRLTNLSVEHDFEPGLRPFIYQEVIDLGGEAVKSTEYIHIGRVTEFKFGFQLGRAVRKWDGQKLSAFGGQFIEDKFAVTFVDNHDNQRGHGASGPFVVSFSDPREYKIAQAFTLANVYGVTQIMSSFEWKLDWQGPPRDSNFARKPVITHADGTCGNEWVCEHRWPVISSMVKFRNVVSTEILNHWWDNGNHQIAFSRNTKGFIAINNDDYDMVATIYTPMLPGIYCDIITGIVKDGTCTGNKIIVEKNPYPDGVGGFIKVEISKDAAEPIVALHIGAKID